MTYPWQRPRDPVAEAAKRRAVEESAQVARDIVLERVHGRRHCLETGLLRPSLTEAAQEVGQAGAFGRKPAPWAATAVRDNARHALTESTVMTARTVAPQLSEAAPAVAAGGRIKVRVIAPGRGSCGYYSAEVLKRDGATAFPARTQSFIDHPTQSDRHERPERSVRDLAGQLVTAAYWQEAGPLGPGLYADIEIFENHRTLVDALKGAVGMSIRAEGDLVQEKGPDGIFGPTVKSLSNGLSVDFVTRAGASGAVVV